MQRKRNRWLLLGMLLCSVVYVKGQNIHNTQHLREVKVQGKIKVVKEEAGQRKTEVDTLAMAESVNLSLSELLGKNTPVFIKEYGRGSMATASFRGTAPSHTQVLWSGMSLNSPMLGMVDFSLIPVFFMDDVSLLHGSSSLSKTSGGLGGAVMLNNKVDWQNTFSGRLMAGFSSFSTFDDGVQINWGNKKIQSQTRAFYSKSDNDFKYVNKSVLEPNADTTDFYNPTMRNRNGDWQNVGAMEEIYWHANSKNFFALRYWGQYTDRSLPMLETFESGSDDELPAQLNNQIDKSHRVSLNWKYYGTRWHWDISSGLNLSKMNYWLKARTNDTNYYTAINSNSDAKSWYNRATGKWDIKENLSLELNGNADFHKVHSFEEIDTIGYNAQRWELSAMIKLAYNYRDRIYANALVRQDVIGGEYILPVPSVGVDYRLIQDHELFFFTSIARNYHAPTLNDLYYVPGGNPDLKPEEGFSWDGGVRWSIEQPRWSLQSTLSGYYSDIDNWIIWLPTQFGFWEPDNIKNVHASGIEITESLGGVLHEKWEYTLSANYAYTRSINFGDPMNWADESVGKQLPYIPEHSANISAVLGYKGWKMHYKWSYYSERYTTTSNETTTDRDYLYPYFMNDLILEKSVTWHDYLVNGQFKINNLFNEDYRTVLYRPMPGINFSFLLSIHF